MLVEARLGSKGECQKIDDFLSGFQYHNLEVMQEKGFRRKRYFLFKCARWSNKT
ncbi:hypothetical protein AM1_C0049 (plasmid) [Acaryochloris marina MBIC11017]|uniref:Uncharacterized protein n=1 Tax=Acaryochloris marina (strain MBIC 11017) TaxID=329726 RepID=A8ZME8_ACAM1|nr:hypothetical protein AM1_C0049 [Acaryochloris marina MBIC11017]